MAPLALIALAAGLAIAGRKKRPTKKPGSNANLEECVGITDVGGHLAGLDYVEIVTGGVDPNSRLPMIISLHGLGYNSSSHIKWLEQIGVPARIILPNGFYAQSGNQSKRVWWRSYSHTALKNASKGIARFVWLIQQCRPTVGRPVITGHSMGGFVALDFATQFPELISASVPVAATRSKSLWDIYPRVPVHAVHGKLDNSYSSGAAYYYEMSQRGLPVYLTTVDGGAHRISSANAEAWIRVLSYLVS